MKDFLAIIMFTTGSSHARGPDKEAAIEQVQKTFVSDWKSLFDVYDKPLKVGVYDVTGFDSLAWDHGGVHTEDGGKVPLLEVRDVRTPPKPSRRGTR